MEWMKSAGRLYNPMMIGIPARLPSGETMKGILKKGSHTLYFRGDDQSYCPLPPSLLA